MSQSGTGGAVTRVGVVVVNFGSHDLLERNLVTIDGGRTPRHVVVVDNLTTADERTRCQALAARHGWRLIEPASNLGFGAAMNLGVEAAFGAGCDAVLLLNPDVAIDANAIDDLVAALERQRDAILTPRLMRPDGTTWFAGGQIDLATGVTRTRPDLSQVGRGRWLTGACLLIGAATWSRLGGFDDRYFLYWEDVDLTQRQLEAGGELIVVDDVRAVHSVGGTQRSIGKTPLYCFYNTRNRLLFASLHIEPRAQRRWVLGAPRYAWRTTMLSGRRVALSRPSLAWGSLRGTCSGLVIVAKARRSSRRHDGIRRS